MASAKTVCEHCGRIIEDTNKAAIWKKGEKTYCFCCGACEKAFKEMRMTREEALR